MAEAPGQQLTEAQTRTPLLGPSGPACTLSFEYALTGKLDHIGNEINSVFFLLLTFSQDTQLQSFILFIYFLLNPYLTMKFPLR